MSGYLIALAFMAGVAVGFVLGRLGERIDAVPDPTVPETPYPRERPLGPPDDEATVSFAGSCTCHRSNPRHCPVHGPQPDPTPWSLSFAGPCKECGAPMRRVEWPGDSWVYQCPRGHELVIGK